MCFDTHGVSCSPEVLHEYDHGIDHSKPNPKSVVHLRQAQLASALVSVIV